MPNIHGNIPNNVFYGSTMAEILRIARASLKYEDFLIPTQTLLKRMIYQGGNTKMLEKQINKAVGRNPQICNKYNKNARDIIADINF